MRLILVPIFLCLIACGSKNPSAAKDYRSKEIDKPVAPAEWAKLIPVEKEVLKAFQAGALAFPTGQALPSPANGLREMADQLVAAGCQHSYTEIPPGEITTDFFGEWTVGDLISDRTCPIYIRQTFKQNPDKSQINFESLYWLQPDLGVGYKSLSPVRWVYSTGLISKEPDGAFGFSFIWYELEGQPTIHGWTTLEYHNGHGVFHAEIAFSKTDGTPETKIEGNYVWDGKNFANEKYVVSGFETSAEDYSALFQSLNTKQIAGIAVRLAP